ncbi:MAG: DUF1820 domain-containing protein [Acidobacteria bacterium]|nr:MAG: DUF1820 domain-containing protein [Acidobacteriota bacterium]
MNDDPIYRISFMNQGEVYEIYARNVGQGEMFAFIEVEELIFGERSQILIDSSEDRLKNEFKGVRRTFIPIHSIIRIDQVDRAGSGRIRNGEGKVSTFPMPLITPRGSKDKG